MTRTNLAADSPAVGSRALQSPTPYADALARYADRDTLRLNVPGHAARGQTSPRLADYFGEKVLRMDVPPFLPGLDRAGITRSRRLEASLPRRGAPTGLGSSPTVRHRRTASFASRWVPTGQRAILYWCNVVRTHLSSTASSSVD
jgi:hypothetical protein